MHVHPTFQRSSETSTNNSSVSVGPRASCMLRDCIARLQFMSKDILCNVNIYCVA